MDEVEREAFLARFAVEGAGWDSPCLAARLLKASTWPARDSSAPSSPRLGLPQFNPVNEELRRRLDAEFGAGYDYTYLFPGIRKVVQAAGRVIRTPSDRGVLHLIDDRFARPEVLRLLPSWWRIGASTLLRLEGHGCRPQGRQHARGIVVQRTSGVARAPEAQPGHSTTSTCLLQSSRW